MVSSGMLRRLALLSTDVSEKLSASFIRVTRIGELGTTLAVFLRSVHRLLVTASVVPSLPILVDEGGAKFHRNVCPCKIHTA
jgi:hypothetical protein